MKRCSTSPVIRELSLKHHRDSTTHQLKWPKSKTGTTPTVGEDVEQKKLSFIAGEKAKWDSHFGGHFGYFL